MTAATSWPIDPRGIIESVVTTPQSDGSWNVAALGLHAGQDHRGASPVRARTWGATRTRRNFERVGRGYVQFVDDPVTFVDAALDRWTRDEPLLEDAAAWVEVDASKTAEGETGGTEWIDWQLEPVEAAVRRREVPLTTRATGAIVELTIAVSRHGLESYDVDRLQRRVAYFSDVALRCGGPRERTAVDRVAELSPWADAEIAAHSSERAAGGGMR